jgi:hypothetical protein
MVRGWLDGALISSGKPRSKLRGMFPYSRFGRLHWPDASASIPASMATPSPKSTVTVAIYAVLKYNLLR